MRTRIPNPRIRVKLSTTLRAVCSHVSFTAITIIFMPIYPCSSPGKPRAARRVRRGLFNRRRGKDSAGNDDNHRKDKGHESFCVHDSFLHELFFCIRPCLAHRLKRSCLRAALNTFHGIFYLPDQVIVRNAGRSGVRSTFRKHSHILHLHS